MFLLHIFSCTVVEISLKIFQKALDSDPSTIFDLAESAGGKIGIYFHFLYVLKFTNATKRKFNKRFLNDDPVMRGLYVLGAQPYSRMFEFINRKLQQFFEGGIMDFYLTWFKELHSKNRFEEYKEPFKVLTLEELEAGFVISFAPLLFAIVTFCVEWLVVLKDFVLAKCIFNAIFKIHRDQIEAQSDNLRLKILLWKKIVKERQKRAQARLKLSSMGNASGDN